jgi:hypothetical protein
LGKGKVERAIGYARQNFWPLRSFTDLADVNAQARQWLQEVANQRQHRENGQKPDERFQVESLRPLQAVIPDYRDTAEALVYKDTRLVFDGNRYCVPPRYVGSRLTVKADASAVAIFDQHHEVATYSRSWQRGQTLGAERFEKELRAQMAAAERSPAQQSLVALLGPAAAGTGPSGSGSCAENRQRLGRPATAAVHAAEIRELHRAGIGKSEIARRLNIGQTSVRRMLA